MSNEVRKLPKIKVDNNNNGSTKKKKCPYCGFYMSSTEKVCPTCGQKYPGTLYSVLACIVLVLSIVTITSCMKSCTSSSDTDTTTTSENVLVTTSTITGIESGNPLMSCDVTIIDVLNGSGDTVIGQRAEIHTTKAIVDNLSTEEFHEFVENVVIDKGYSWFTINYDDGSGICFAGAKTSVIEYGTLDEEGRINTLLQDINYDDMKGNAKTQNISADANPKIMELLQSTYYVTGVISDIKIEYDNSSGTNMYSVYITGDGLTLGLQEVRNGHQPESNWATIVDNNLRLADDTYQRIKAIDSTANLMVNIVNDLNPDNALIIVIDGVLFYDALNDE